LRRFDTHRLIPEKYSDESVLGKLTQDDADLALLFELENLTNDRLQAENNRHQTLGPRELVFSVPCAQIINAAFSHPHPLGSRFNGPERGAWYASFELETSEAEVAYHKTLELAEIDWWHESFSYVDFLADFSAELHDLCGDDRFSACLDPESYVASQTLAEQLFAQSSLGIVYPSVRRAGGTCLACFQPALVGNVRKGAQLRFLFEGTPVVSVERMLS
jgi:RES domain